MKFECFTVRYCISYCKYQFKLKLHSMYVHIRELKVHRFKYQIVCFSYKQLKQRHR